jgi:hypothetical protein
LLRQLPHRRWFRADEFGDLKHVKNIRWSGRLAAAVLGGGHL